MSELLPRIVATVTLLGSLVLSGCSSPELPSTGQEPYTFSVESETPPEDNPDLLRSVVEVYRERSGGQAPDAGTGTVVTNGDQKGIVTAGHVANDITRCKDLTIVYPQSEELAAVLTSKVKAETDVDLSFYNPVTYNGGRDSAFMIPDTIPSEIPGVPIAEYVRARPGKWLTMVGYGPRKNYDPSPLAKVAADRQPVVMHGIYLGDLAAGSVEKMIVAVPGKADADGSVHHGDSGGPAFIKSESGKYEYLGDVTYIAADNIPATQLTEQYGIQLPTTNAKQDYNLMYVDPVRQRTITELGQLVTCS